MFIQKLRMKDKILELRKKGLTVNEIVKELKCAKSTVSYHINKIGLGGNRDKFLTGVDDNIIEQIKQLRLNDKTYDEILTLINISKDKLKKICRVLGLSKQRKGFKPIILDKKKVLEYYLNVKSIRQTAIFFNVSRDTIRNNISNDKIIFKKEIKITKSQAVIDWRKRKKIELVEYKGGKCEKCGYKKSIAALQFHHKNPNQKDFAISSKSYSFERLKKEVDKCIMVCANCHIEIHEELRQNKLDS